MSGARRWLLFADADEDLARRVEPGLTADEGPVVLACISNFVQKYQTHAKARLSSRAGQRQPDAAYLLFSEDAARALATPEFAQLRAWLEEPQIELVVLDAGGPLDGAESAGRAEAGSTQAWSPSPASIGRIIPVRWDRPIDLILPRAGAARGSAGGALPATNDLVVGFGIECTHDMVTRGAARDAVSERVTWSAEDLIRLEWQDGTVDWMSAASYRERFPTGPERRPARDRAGTDVGLARLTAERLRFADLVELVEALLGAAGREALAELRPVLDDDGAGLLTDRLATRLVSLIEDVLARARERSDATTAPGPAGAEGLSAPSGRLTRVRAPDASPRLAPLHGKPEWRKDEEVLLLLHGSFLPAELGFRDLLVGDAWSRIQARFGDRVLAFQHRSWSRSPAENAADLLRALDGAGLTGRGAPPLVLVSHSRGGLVGELLCARAPLATVPPSWTDADRGHMRAIDQLRGTLRVARFVRVAAPTRGTSLLSDRLDVWISAMLRLLSAVASASASPVAKQAVQLSMFLCKVALRYIKRPEAVPGLAAMRPRSPFPLWLSHAASEPEHRSVGLLYAVTGRSASLPILKKGAASYNLAVTVGDAFFAGPNDLIVDTSSMDGGLLRPSDAARVLRSAAPGLNHGRYFDPTLRDGPSGSILLAIVGDAAANARFNGAQQAVQRGGDERGGLDYVSMLPSLEREVPALIPARPGELPRGGVLIVPGLMGTRLAEEPATGASRPLWVDLDRLALGYGVHLKWPSVDPEGLVKLGPRGILHPIYADFARFLADRGYRVRTAAYDWRASPGDSAKAVEDGLRALLAEVKGPVHIAAHCMGGLVVRQTFAGRPDLQRDLFARGGRLLMAGTPNLGAPALLNMLAHGRHPMLELLNLFARLTHRAGVRDVRAIVREFPGVLEMLPRRDADMRDAVLSPDWWRKRLATPDWRAPKEAALEGARKTTEALDERLGAFMADDRVVYVAGVAEWTDDEILLDTGVVRATRWSGDGTVPYWSAGTERRWILPAPHDLLFARSAAFGALLDLLERGVTAELSCGLSPGRARQDGVFSTLLARGRGERGELPPPAEPAQPLLPSRAEMLTTLVGGATSANPPAALRVVKLSVTHGDLRYARYPLVIGHHAGSRLSDGEQALDLMLSGELSGLARLSSYPHSQGMHLRVPDRDGLFPGAIVLGLGPSGSLTPLVLFKSLRAAFLQHVLTQATRATGLSVLLIGARDGLSVAEVTTQITRAAIETNDELLERQRDEQLHEVEIIELRLDRALAARAALQHLEPITFGHGRSRTSLEVEWYMRTAKGGLNSDALARPDLDRSYLVHISLDESTGDLRISLTSDRARIESEPHRLDLVALRRLVDLARQGAADDVLAGRSVGHVLFHTAIPERFRARMEVTRPMRLFLDASAADLPWELMRDDHQDRPAVTRFVLTRQLVVEGGRESPIDAGIGRALVLADLEADAPLPGATAEGREVAALFADHGWQVETRAIGPGVTAEDVHALLTPPSGAVLHIAAHGVLLKRGDEVVPAIALPGGRHSGSDTPRHVLSAERLAGLNPLPQIVFLNTCHSGRLVTGARLTPHHQRFARDIATALIGAGVRAVVVTGWAVHDGAASVFGRVFWESMLGGATLGEASLRARAEAWHAYPWTDTYGAYHVYGDANLRLGTVQGRAPLPDITSSRAALDRVDQIRQRLRDARSRGGAAADAVGRARDALEDLELRLAVEWRDDADLALRLGQAWGDLVDDIPDLARALLWLQHAATRERGARAESLEAMLEIWSQLLWRRYELGEALPDALQPALVLDPVAHPDDGLNRTWLGPDLSLDPAAALSMVALLPQGEGPRVGWGARFEAPTAIWGAVKTRQILNRLAVLLPTQRRYVLLAQAAEVNAFLLRPALRIDGLKRAQERVAQALLAPRGERHALALLLSHLLKTLLPEASSEDTSEAQAAEGRLRSDQIRSELEPERGTFLADLSSGYLDLLDHLVRDEHLQDMDALARRLNLLARRHVVDPQLEAACRRDMRLFDELISRRETFLNGEPSAHEPRWPPLAREGVARSLRSLERAFLTPSRLPPPG